MKHCLVAALALLCSAGISLTQPAGKDQKNSPDTRLFEMRTYYAAPGKLDQLQSRFRDHTVKLFEKHGMQNIGYWVPVENPENKLIYILTYPSGEAREKSWKQFSADPDWQKARKVSEENGRLVAKAESLFMKATDYSPVVKPGESTRPRLFELRVYSAAPGKMDALHKRFREHTVDLFTKHGMSHLGYWTPTEPSKTANDTLIYIVAHHDQAAANQSWKDFRADPDWIKAKSASEIEGSLTAQNGVKTVLMLPTDYSPTK